MNKNKDTEANQIIQRIKEAAQTAENNMPENPIQWIETTPPTTKEALAAYFDHTFLKPTASKDTVQHVCNEAIQHAFATVCIPPWFVLPAVIWLENSSVLPITVIGFPLGYQETKIKALETRAAIESGAKEIDMVINLAALKSEDWETVFKDIQVVVQAAGDIPVKVIIETSYLTQEEKIQAYYCVQAAEATFIKTSTGFSDRGAEIRDIQLFHGLNEMAVFPDKPKLKIKASGGIRSLDDALAMIQAGANRLGASKSVDILSEFSP